MKVDSDNIAHEFIRAKRAISNFKIQNLQIQDTKKSTISIRPIKSIPKQYKPIWEKNKKYIRKEHYYKAKIDIEFENMYFEDIENMKINSNDFFIGNLLPDQVLKRYMELIMILNLCRIGGFHFGLGLMVSPTEIKTINKNYFYGTDLFDFSIDKKWPTFINLGITKTWNWFLNKVNPKGPDEISSTPLSRAFNAYSFFYEQSEDINKLFWCLLGLESIYVEGKEGIAEQLKKKGQLFLGEISEFKKRLAQMYDYRSSFIHGSKDFFSYFHINDGIDSYKNHTNEFYNILLTAESMLIATLQKMAYEDLSELKFQYIIKKYHN